MGKRGYNDTVAALMQSASEAWDWTYLLCNEPMEKHVRAFVRVLVAFSAHFRNIERPSLSYVQWPWPLVPDVAKQYILLLKRIRNRERLIHCFSSTPKVEVRRVAFRSFRQKILARNTGWSQRIWWLICFSYMEAETPNLTAMRCLQSALEVCVCLGGQKL